VRVRVRVFIRTSQVQTRFNISKGVWIGPVPPTNPHSKTKQNRKDQLIAAIQ